MTSHLPSTSVDPNIISGSATDWTSTVAWVQPGLEEALASLAWWWILGWPHWELDATNNLTLTRTAPGFVPDALEDDPWVIIGQPINTDNYTDPLHDFDNTKASGFGRAFWV
jgi:hypothetical protein